MQWLFRVSVLVAAVLLAATVAAGGMAVHGVQDLDLALHDVYVVFGIHHALALLLAADSVTVALVILIWRRT